MRLQHVQGDTGGLFMTEQMLRLECLSCHAVRYAVRDTFMHKPELQAPGYAGDQPHGTFGPIKFKFEVGDRTPGRPCPDCLQGTTYVIGKALMLCQNCRLPVPCAMYEKGDIYCKVCLGVD